MQVVKVLWAFLWILPKALGKDFCAGQSFGSRAVDSADPQSYYLCLGFIGPIKNTCKNGYLFDAQTQGCVIMNNATQSIKKSNDIKKEVNIKQNISVDRPVIFNIFGNFNFFASLWGNSHEATPSPLKHNPIAHFQFINSAVGVEPLSQDNLAEKDKKDIIFSFLDSYPTEGATDSSTQESSTRVPERCFIDCIYTRKFHTRKSLKHRSILR
ncbi:GM24715 [Drosophila sechellia]|uniref:GM24715 n=1 Tax=Drosophila sechellia TaxID=7238 RepID=B4HEY5_DROSE|nr:GM24715 [Drosophila sechellia]